MGVQGARPHAGGTGASPENLPFFCTGDENEKINKNILAAGRKHGMLALHY